MARDNIETVHVVPSSVIEQYVHVLTFVNFINIYFRKLLISNLLRWLIFKLLNTISGLTPSHLALFQASHFLNVYDKLYISKCLINNILR